jgi:hypothetical protein
MVGANAAELYGFDLDALAPVAARVGPAIAEVATPLPADEVPIDARRCPAFAEVPGAERPGRSAPEEAPACGADQ